ncbi:hypothetical protein IAE57_01015 [Stenotrophomonas sp. S48]|uniref:hypothetical protein n=1 Tax=unclassified Stenotrophomonas TaxID=196198 RepID=UPI001901C85B|nr:MULTISPECIES: hypothetical protein [unclassified Stenotrophomonas]MBK0024733.1 hypothetical protein [Stenotrophomonas sp. S48]MBK0046953.1 hypothetical protein [Stenotrophomonas sp. S49]
MKTLTLATRLDAPLRLHPNNPQLVGVEHLPGAIAAQMAEAPRGHLLAWSAVEAGIAGFSQDGRHLLLPLPILGAGIGSMRPAKGGGFITLFVRTDNAQMLDVLGSDTFDQAALDGLLGQRAPLGELLGCALDVEDWGYDC